MAPKKKKSEPGPADKGCEYIRAKEQDNLVALLDSMNVRQISKHEIKSGKNMLHVAVEEENYVMVTILLDYGCKVNFRTKDMKTALMIAVSKGLDDIYDFLILSGADVCIPDANGNTVLHIACHKGNLKMSTAIIDELKKIVKKQEEEKEKEAKRKEAQQRADDDDNEEEEEEEEEKKTSAVADGLAIPAYSELQSQSQASGAPPENTVESPSTHMNASAVTGEADLEQDGDVAKQDKGEEGEKKEEEEEGEEEEEEKGDSKLVMRESHNLFRRIRSQKQRLRISTSRCTEDAIP